MKLTKSGLRKGGGLELKIDMSPMIDCVFQLLIFFIVTLKMDPSLDDIMKLPNAFKSARQEELNMEIYVLPAGMAVTSQGTYTVDGWLRPDGTLNYSEGMDFSGQIAFAAKGNFDSMFIRLDDVPYLIDREREKKGKDLLRRLNSIREQNGRAAFTKAEEDSVKKDMTLLMKVHKDVFYGRVLQIVDKAKEAGVTSFAFVSSVQSSQLMEEKNKK